MSKFGPPDGGAAVGRGWRVFIGYGHYELTISSSEGTKTIVTGNMDLIERLNSEIDKEKEEATAEAIALVLESSL